MGDDFDIYGDLVAEAAAPVLLLEKPSPGSSLALTAAPPQAPKSASLQAKPAGTLAAPPPRTAEPEPPISAPADRVEDGDLRDPRRAYRLVNRAPAPKPAPKAPAVEPLIQEVPVEEQVPVVPGSPLSEGEEKDKPEGSDTAGEDGFASDGSEGQLITLDEVRASEMGARPLSQFGVRKWAGAGPAGERSESTQLALTGDSEAQGSRIRRKEVHFFIGPPPPLPAGTASTAVNLLLVGGLPWWFNDVELRRACEQYGQVRSVRILDHPSNGRSVGIALVDFVVGEGPKRAAAPAEGLRSLGLWRSMGVAAPQATPVSTELFPRLRAGVLPWPDGGPCAEELRAVLMRQFGLTYAGSKKEDRPPPPAREPPPGRRRGPDRADSDLAPRGGRSSPPAAAKGDNSNWAAKLKALKGGVNNRQELAASRSFEALEVPEAKRRR